MNLLPLLFVGLGAVLLLAAWAVWHRGQRVRECVRALLALPDDTHPMDWPLQASPVLRRAGIGGMAWSGQWFGDPVQGQWGNAANPDWTGLTLEAGPDCAIELSWAGLARTDEARALALVVVDVFVQSWLSRMRQRTQAVAVALAQRAHVHLYWQHDMRNLAQWVGLMADEFSTASPEQLPRLAQRLQQQAPLVLSRVHKLLGATENSAPPPPAPSQSASGPDPQPSATRSALVVATEAAHLAGLSLHCVPADPGAGAEPLMDVAQARAMERALDNVLSNIARDSAVRVRGPALQLHWQMQAGQFQARLLTPRLSAPWPARPFEPMQVGSGSGLGLYQARRSLRDVGGDLVAKPSPEGVEFGLTVALRAQRQHF